ncbi:MAG: hypothetical protein DMG00_20700, partial [Acidobacteria bacterium]
YVLLGDGESAEGSVWEAGNVAVIDRLDNLCAITDVNGLGQSRPTMWNHDLEQFARRWRAFGWHALVIDGHDVAAVLDALLEARNTSGRPTMILARTIKGKGVSFAEGKEGWHGKAFKKGEEMDRAIAELEKQFVPVPAGGQAIKLAAHIPRPPTGPRAVVAPKPSVQHGPRQARCGGLTSRRARRRREELDLQRQIRESVSRPVFSELYRRAGDGGIGHGARGARRHTVSVDVCMLPVARGRFHPHGRHQQRRREARRIARRRVDRRRRAVADGARGSRDIPRPAELHRLVSVRRRQRRAARRARGECERAGVHPHEPAEDAGHLRQRRDVFDRRAEGTAPELAGRGDGDWRRRDGVRGAQSVRPAEGARDVNPRDRPLLCVAGRSRRTRRRGARDRRPCDYRGRSLCGGRCRRRGRRSGSRCRVHRASARRP